MTEKEIQRKLITKLINKQVFKLYGNIYKCELCRPDRCIYGNDDCVFRTRVSDKGKSIEKYDGYMFRVLFNSIATVLINDNKFSKNTVFMEDLMKGDSDPYNDEIFSNEITNDYFLRYDKWDELIYDDADTVCETFDEKGVFDWYKSLSIEDQEFLYCLAIKDDTMKQLSQKRNVSTSYMYKYKDKFKKSLLDSLNDLSYIFERRLIKTFDEKQIIEQTNKYLDSIHNEA